MALITNLEITLTHYLILSSLIFIIGICGIFINRKNVISILMSIELILLSVNINLVSFSAYLQDLTGQIFSLFVLTVAAAEAAIGLAIIVVYYRNRGNIEVEDISQMRG
jgi:NADH-quinone oxidoreductase subunit K